MRIAGTRVSRENRTAEMGAKKTESCTAATIREFIPVIWLFFASSISKQSQALAGICMAPLNKAATKKNQKPSARHQIIQGTHQAKKSKKAVAFRRPNLSVTGPLKKAKTTWENV